MPSRVRVECSSEGCGFTGAAQTGWIHCPPPTAAKLAAEGFQLSPDGRLVRLRVRQLACPRCMKRTLRRAMDPRVSALVADLSRAMARPL